MDRLNIKESTVVLRSIKKRKYDRNGNSKQNQYRSIPIPEDVMDLVSIAFNLLAKQKKKSRALLWPSESNAKTPINESTVYRWVKRNMTTAGITGKKATSKGLRHSFGVHMVLNNCL